MRTSRRVTALFLTALVFVAAGRAEGAEKTRPPALAGAWYPKERAALAEMVDKFLADAAPVRVEGRVTALIAPHAGYVYSGAVAGHAFRQVKGAAFRRVIIVAPTHRSGFRGFSIMDVSAYATPLGPVPLDAAVCAALARHQLHVREDSAHVREHAIEIELPFLQRCLTGFQIVPILVGGLAPGDAGRIADALRPHVTAETLVVASSDFTHYGPNYGYVPFDPEIEANLRQLDRGAADLILKKDAAGFEDYLARTGATICGRNGISILLRLLPSETKGQLLKYDTSGRMTGDFANSVSYAALLFAQPGPEGGRNMEADRPLTLPEEKTLLRLARDTIAECLAAGRMPAFDSARYPLTPRLREKAGAFVTLKKQGHLRGCIGRIGYPELADDLPPLYETIRLMAVEASQRDPRFPPVTPDEMKDIEIEISVLTIAREADGWQDFEVGRHGIIIRKGRSAAVFLPQVAPEQGWDRETTLAHLCRKAFLPPDEWRKPGMKFFLFTAHVFNEGALAKR